MVAPQIAGRNKVKNGVLSDSAKKTGLSPN
jgi:hypothetical protein